eukprot:PhM_4_TR9803/c0_g1_i1/m.46687
MFLQYVATHPHNLRHCCHLALGQRLEGPPPVLHHEAVDDNLALVAGLNHKGTLQVQGADRQPGTTPDDKSRVLANEDALWRRELPLQHAAVRCKRRTKRHDGTKSNGHVQERAHRKRVWVWQRRDTHGAQPPHPRGVLDRLAGGSARRVQALPRLGGAVRRLVLHGGVAPARELREANGIAVAQDGGQVLHHALEARWGLEHVLGPVGVLGVDELGHQSIRRRQDAVVALDVEHESVDVAGKGREAGLGVRRIAARNAALEHVVLDVDDELFLLIWVRAVRTLRQARNSPNGLFRATRDARAVHQEPLFV